MARTAAARAAAQTTEQADAAPATPPTTSEPTPDATVKSFGRPRPVVCDDEAHWFEASVEMDTKQAAQEYIRERFDELLNKEEIEQLASNNVMLQIIEQHQQLFQQHSGTDRSAHAA